MRGPLLSSFVVAATVIIAAAPVVSPASPATIASAQSADGLSSEELLDLARRAETDPDALEELRSVDEVEGLPVDLEAALRGAGSQELESRLEALTGEAGAAAGPAPDSGAAGAARSQARSILEEPRFRPATLPRPLRGFLELLGRPLEPVLRAAQRLWRALAARLPGGEATLWSLIAGAVILVAAALARRAGRRAGPGSPRSARPNRSAAAHDPRTLERLADEAERAGEHERAVRLRFGAGLLRLHDSGVISFRPSITSGEVRRLVHSTEFDEVAAGFDAIVYGGRRAGELDAQTARRKWSRILSGVS